MKTRIKFAAVHSKEVEHPKIDFSASQEAVLATLVEYKKRNIEKMCEFLHEAGRNKADLVATHEAFEESGTYFNYERPEMNPSLAEEIPGPISDRFSGIAKKYDMYITANYYEKENGRIYNTSVLIDRKGRIEGKYRKVHLPTKEGWICTPGDEFTVLKSDIGNIGFATCFDMKFPEHCKCVSLNGADIIIHQTQGWGMGIMPLGEPLLKIRAIDSHVYLLVVKNIQDSNSAYGKSCLIDNFGRILGEAGGEEEKILYVEVEPDFDRNEKDLFSTLTTGVESARAKYLLQRRPLLYKIMSEPEPELMRQYKGLEMPRSPEQIRASIRRTKKYNDDIKNNRPVEVKYHY